jgi:transcriptional regulator with XRE-family HTH domain
MKTEFRYGRKIKEMREARAWTQEQLAEAADIDSTRTIQRVEKDLTKNPETLQAIAGAFNVDLERLRSTLLIPESRLVRAHFVDSHERFVGIEESHRWHAYTRTILAPLTKENQKQVEDFLDHIFSDRDLIEPDERELWKGYVQQIEEPLTSLFALKLAIFILSERRDLILPKNGFLKPEKPYIDDWRIQYFLVVPEHGCFRTSPSEPLHRFNEDCKAAGDVIFNAVTHEDAGLHLFVNVLAAILETTNWCDVCFPVHSDGSRLSLEYLEQITGLKRNQWYDLLEESTCQDFLQGLA